MDKTEKSISLRLPGKLAELLRSLVGGGKNMSDVIRDRLDIGLKIADEELASKQKLWTLMEDQHQSMSAILDKSFGHLASITRAEILFMAGEIQQYCYGNSVGVTARRYVQLVELVGDLYEKMTSCEVKVDEHYLVTELRALAETTTDIRELLQNHRAYCVTNNRPMDLDGLSKVFLCLIEDSWQLEETVYMAIMRPDMDLLVTLACNAIFSKKPYAISPSRSLLPRPLSEHRSHKDFTISVYNIQGFDCVIETPHALITTDYRGFYKLWRMQGLLNDPHVPQAYLPFSDDVRLCFPVADVVAIQAMCQDIASVPAFVAHNKLLALAYGVAE